LHDKKELEEYVEAGTAPIFGYPPICYSPVESSAKKQEVKTSRAYVSTLMKHVFQDPDSGQTVEDIITAT
jgi:hypothetical protein